MRRSDPEARMWMVGRLQRVGILKSPEVVVAMSKVPRHIFVPSDLAPVAYQDEPLPLGEGQTISAPHMVAMMLEALGPQSGHKVLEVGAGSGYHAALLAELVRPSGQVVSIERIHHLAVRARENLRAAGYPEVEVVEGDGSMGHAERSPYDRILVTAASPAPPPPLLDQLAHGGRLVIPVGTTYSQDLLQVERSPTGMRNTNLGGCAFVPLLGKYGFGGERDCR